MAVAEFPGHHEIHRLGETGREGCREIRRQPSDQTRSPRSGAVQHDLPPDLDRLVGAVENQKHFAHIVRELLAHLDMAGAETPEQIGPLVARIKQLARHEYGREMDPDHFGTSVAFRFGSWDDPAVSRQAESYLKQIGRAHV